MKLLEDLHNQKDDLKNEMKEQRQQVKLPKRGTAHQIIPFLFICQLASFNITRLSVTFMGDW